jgi:hypothetical protein
MLHLPLNHYRLLVEGDGPSLMRLDGGASLCHVLIEQLSILDFALYDHKNGHSIILRTHLRDTSPPNASLSSGGRAESREFREISIAAAVC